MKYRDKSQTEKKDVQVGERKKIKKLIKRAWFEDGKVTAYHLHPQDFTPIQIIQETMSWRF